MLAGHATGYDNHDEFLWETVRIRRVMISYGCWWHIEYCCELAPGSSPAGFVELELCLALCSVPCFLLLGLFLTRNLLSRYKYSTIYVGLAEYLLYTDKGHRFPSRIPTECIIAVAIFPAGR